MTKVTKVQFRFSPALDFTGGDVATKEALIIITELQQAHT